MSTSISPVWYGCGAIGLAAFLYLEFLLADAVVTLYFEEKQHRLPHLEIQTLDTDRVPVAVLWEITKGLGVPAQD